MAMNPGEAARLAKAKREKGKHDATADNLNKTTYADKGEGGYTDPRTSTQGLASRMKKKPLTAGDAAAALAKRKKESY